MGSIEYDEYQLSSGGGDRSRPIGSYAAETKITLTRIGRKDGKIVYLEEIPAFMRHEWLHMPFRKGSVRKSEPSSHGWCRMAVRVPKNHRSVFASDIDEDGKTQGDFLNAARWPYSSGIAFWTPFRNENSKGSKALARKLPEAFESGVDFVKALEELPFDYVETGKNVTASISMPPQSNLDSTLNALKQKVSFIFGVCEDPHGFATELADSATARQLIELTDNGTLRFTHPKVGVFVPIEANVKEMATLILNCSIRQALAGLHNDDFQEKRDWTLEMMIDKLYRDHVNAFNRSFVNKKNEKPGRKRTRKATVSLQENDRNSGRLPSQDKMYEGIDVLLSNDLADISEIPDSGHSLLILARIHGRLHLRAFGDKGTLALDSDLSSRVDQDRLVEFTTELDRLWPPHALSESERIWVVRRSLSLLASN